MIKDSLRGLWWLGECKNCEKARSLRKKLKSIHLSICDIFLHSFISLSFWLLLPIPRGNVALSCYWQRTVYSMFTMGLHYNPNVISPHGYQYHSQRKHWRRFTVCYIRACSMLDNNQWSLHWSTLPKVRSSIEFQKIHNLGLADRGPEFRELWKKKRKEKKVSVGKWGQRI